MDDLNKVFIVLTTFVGFTTSVFSASYIGHEIEIGRLTPTYVRFYHAMYQVLMFAMNLALVANNIGLMWVAIEMATLTTVLMVGIYRTHEALEAAWKYFILGSVGIALALFGTILVYMAARPVIGEGLDAMVWTVLVTQAAKFDPALLNVAFVFLLLGYGTKVGLAPLHAWLPDAHAEGPTPISAVLSGLLLNVALYALLRFKMLLALNPAAIAPGPLMVTMGLISCVFAAFMLYRRRDIKRMFAYSSIEHMGIIVFAFGMGGPLANFAGLLHMTMHSLTKSAIFFAVGHIAQVKGTQKIADMGGLTVTNPVLGWGLVLGVVAIAGLPPLGIFMSEFLVVSSTFAREPWLAIIWCSESWSRSAACSCGSTPLPSASRAGRPRRRRPPTCRCSRISPSCSWPASTCRRRWSPASRTSPGCWDSAMALLDIIAHRERPSSTGRGRARSSPTTAGGRRSIISPRAAARCSACGATRATCTWRCWTKLFDDIAVLSYACKDGTYPSVGAAPPAGDPPGARHPRSVRAGSDRRAGHAALARSRVLGRAPSARQTETRARSPRLTPFCRRRAKACTRFRSARCMPASSSPAISASPPMASTSCGWSSGSAMCTRASSR